MRFPAVITLVIISAIALNGQSLLWPNADAYQVSLLAGVATPDGLKDGFGDQAGFIRPTAIWGDGTYLYVGDGPALRRIEIATRKVTTVTRLAASGRNNSRTGSGAPYLSGIGGLWGDGTNVYAVDMVDTSIRRINLATGLADVVSGPTKIIFGLVGDGQYLYGGDSVGHVIKRIDRNTGTIADFVTPPGPIDPYRCFLGSGCVAYWVASPTSLFIDGDYIYATGYNTSLRIINRQTGDTTSSATLPFVPTSVWENNGVAYFTEYGGSRIGKLTLATGSTEIVFPGNSVYGPFGPIWGSGNFLYIIEGHQILQLDLTTRGLLQFAGSDYPNAASVDGVGTNARFSNGSNIWSDGANLYIVDNGSIRRLNLATAEVTTLSAPRVRAIWGSGTYIYATSYQSGSQLLRIALSDGSITTVATLSDPYGGDFIAGDASYIYVSENNRIERVAMDGTTVTAISIYMPFFGGGSIWSDGTYLFVAGTYKIVRYSIATGATSDLALLPGFPNAMWSDGENLFVSENTAPRSSVRLLKVSIATGDVDILMSGGPGDAAGTPISLPGYVWGVGKDVYLLSGTGVYKLTPTAMPPFSSFNLPDRAAMRNVTATPPNSGTVTVGSGEIQLSPGSGSSSGLAIITHRENGIVTSEMSVPATAAIRSGRIYASVSASVNTGLVITNPNDQAAVIQFYFTDRSGVSSGYGSLTVAPHAQISSFLTDAAFTPAVPVAPPTTIEGSFTFDSNVPVSAIVVRGYTNERSEFLTTTLPVADLTPTSNNSANVIPDFAEGGGWTTSVILVNRTDSAVAGVLEAHADDGSIVGTTPYMIASRSSSIYSMNSPATAIRTGWTRAVPFASTAAPAATAIFSFKQNGVTVTEAAAAAVDPAVSSRVYTESGNGLQSGVAIANPASHSVTVNFQPTGTDGMPVSTDYPKNLVSVTIPALGHLSIFTRELFLIGFPLPDTGLFRIWTDSPDGIAVTGLRARYNERGDFLVTSTPAFPEYSAAPPIATFFPIFIQGSGYTTEMIVFGNTPGQSTSGSLLYFSQSGTPLIVRLN